MSAKGANDQLKSSYGSVKSGKRRRERNAGSLLVTDTGLLALSWVLPLSLSLSS